MFTWMLHHFATGYFGKSEEWVLDQMTDVPSNVTFESQTRLKEICDLCDDEILKKANETQYLIAALLRYQQYDVFENLMR